MTRAEGRGFQKIGSLVQQTLNLVEGSASIPSRSSPSSEITGLRSLERVVAKSTGTPRSVTVAVSLREALSGKHPATTDRSLLASLPRSVRLALREITTEIRYPANGGYSGGEIIGYEPLDISETERIEARALVKRALDPVHEKDAKMELLRMRASVKTRAEDEVDMKAIAAIYLGYLMDYPPDVVRWACRRWAVTEKFWPSWSELHEMLERGMRVRRALDRVLA